MNPVVETILEILKYTLPALILLIATNLIVKKFLISENEKKRMAIFQEGYEKTLMLRLQAYERLSVLMERMHPRSLISRLYDKNLTVSEFHYILIKNIQDEFEHNLSQQIYVSHNAWMVVTNVKEQELSMINQIASNVNPTAPARELTNKIMDFLQNSESAIPTEIALETLNEEAKMILSIK